MSLAQTSANHSKREPKTSLEIGSIVDVSSPSDNRWIEGTVIEMKGDTVRVLYGNKDKWYIMAFTNKQQSKSKQKSDTSLDMLALRNNSDIRSLFEREGSPRERVLLSEKVKKINRRGWKQERILIISQKAIYYLKSGELNRSRRRINIADVGTITLSTTSDQFDVHVPSQERDCHFISQNKDKITQLLKQLYVKATSKPLVMTKKTKSASRSSLF
eukprot:78306_1